MAAYIQNWKNKMIIIFIVAVIFVVALTVNSLLNHSSSDDASKPSSISVKDARALPKGDQCHSNSVDAKVKTHAQPLLEEDGGFWTSYIYDVPAGVNVNVNIATYNGSDTVAGSLFYSDNYGKYNFIATKQASEWQYTSFARCD